MSKDKKDLEDEMSRFEMEISGQLPPPPKLPNFSRQAAPGTIQPSVTATGHTQPLSLNTSTVESRTRPLLSQPPSFPGITPPSVIRHPPPGNAPFPQMPGQFPVARPPLMNSRPPFSMSPMPLPSQTPPAGGPLQFPARPPPSMGHIHMLQRPPMSAGPMIAQQIRQAPTIAKQSQLSSMPVPASSMQPMMQSRMPFSVPFAIQPPTVPLEEFRPRPSTSAMIPQMVVPVPEVKPETSKDKKKDDKKKKVVRVGGGQVWEDESLQHWDTNDFRIFCGDLGNEVTDDQLYRAFSKYPSLLKAKVIRDKKSQKTKGYGFVSFKNPQEYLKAMREMNGKYLGNRPIKLRKSTWKDRNIEIVKKKDREKKKLGLR